MSVLTIDVGGADEMDVEVSQAGHAEPREVGARRYSFFGREKSLIRAESMVVPVVLKNTTPVTIRTVRALFANGAQILCNGLVFNNGLVDIRCSGEITDEMEQGGQYWITTLTLYEVSNAGTVSGL